MLVPNDPQLINPSRVAYSHQNTTDESLLEYDEYDEERRLLYHRYYGMFDNFELDPEWYLVIEALELKVNPGHPDT